MVKPGEWHPWLAQQLELGSLPLSQGLLVVTVALMPSMAVFVTGAFLTTEYDMPGMISHRRLGEYDNCTANTMAAYFVAALVFAIALFAFGRVLGSNKALVDMIKFNAQAEKDKYLAGISGVVAGEVKKGAKEAAKEGVIAAAKAGGDAEAGLDVASGSVEDKAKAFLEKQLKSSRFYGLFNLVRFIIAEVAILVGLLGPFLLGCGEAGIWATIQAFVGLIGCSLALGIPLWCVLQMSRDSTGMYKYFPGSQSNKLYELSTGIKPRAVLPDKGEVSGKPRMNWITKYQLCACGASIGLGLIIQFISAILLIFGIGGDSSTAGMAFFTFFVCLLSKLPECFMYGLLWYFFILDFWFFMLGLNPFCFCFRRGYDEDDKKELFSCRGLLSCFSTRSDPPTRKCNGCSRWFEKKFFSFYQWCYCFIDKPLSGFTWCKIWPLPPIYIVTGFKWSAVAKEYEEAAKFKAKLEDAIKNKGANNMA